MTMSRRTFVSASLGLVASGAVGASASGAAAPAWAVETAAPTRGSTRHHEVIGSSTRGRAIHAYRLGAAGAASTFVVLGQMHGDELAGWALSRHMLLPATVPDGVQFWVIPTMNPDGRIAGTRTNARGVDLNRNFPSSDWLHQGVGTSTYSGPRPGSEPETRAVRRFLNRLGPFTVVSLHQPFGVVDYSGGDPAVTRWLGGHLGLPTKRLGTSGGNLTKWFNQTWPKHTAVTLELPRPATPEFRRTTARVLVHFSAVRRR